MNIKKAERVKQLTGLKVARACPTISHLLFADDSLFFCKTNKEECQTIFLRNMRLSQGNKLISRNLQFNLDIRLKKVVIKN